MPYVYVLRNDRPEGRYAHGVRYRPEEIPEKDVSNFVVLPDPPDARDWQSPAVPAKGKGKHSEEVR